MYSHGWRAIQYKEGTGESKAWYKHITKTLDDLGYRAEKITFPKKDGKRITVNQICKKRPKGVFILNMHEHVSCIRDGKIFDTFDCGDSWVYYAWRIRKNN